MATTQKSAKEILARVLLETASEESQSAVAQFKKAKADFLKDQKAVFAKIRKGLAAVEKQLAKDENAAWEYNLDSVEIEEFLSLRRSEGDEEDEEDIADFVNDTVGDECVIAYDGDIAKQISKILKPYLDV